jgi:hypothetical protein
VIDLKLLALDFAEIFFAFLLFSFPTILILRELASFPRLFTTGGAQQLFLNFGLVKMCKLFFLSIEHSTPFA